MTGPERSRPSPSSFIDALGDMEVPRGGLSWLSHQATAERISAIATGVVAVSHDGLDTLAMSNRARALARTCSSPTASLPEA